MITVCKFPSQVCQRAWRGPSHMPSAKLGVQALSASGPTPAAAGSYRKTVSNGVFLASALKSDVAGEDELCIGVYTFWSRYTAKFCCTLSVSRHWLFFNMGWRRWRFTEMKTLCELQQLHKSQEEATLCLQLLLDVCFLSYNACKLATPMGE